MFIIFRGFFDCTYLDISKNIWILSNKIAAVATIIVKAKEPRLLYHNKPKGR